MTAPERTYGVFALKFHGLSMKDLSETGWTYDVKWTFGQAVLPDRLFAPEHASLVFGAEQGDGLKLEIRPMLDGEPLSAILVPTGLRGDLKLSENGSVQLVTRVSQEALELAGLSASVFLNASFALECTVSDQPTLEESVRGELKEGQVPIDVEPLLPTEEKDASPPVDVFLPGTLRLDALWPGEDMPFPADDGTEDPKRNHAR